MRRDLHTERFQRLRKKSLDKTFDKKLASKIWRSTVRQQLRGLDIKDLFDHYDFNFNIEDRIQIIKSSILDGSYVVGTPLIYKTEKKLGICRHMVIPQPEDALVLQCLVEQISTAILKKQPSQNAFYSRDKHNVKKPHQAVEYGLSFREQWKNLQKKIYNFTENCNYLVVTDLSNYFDSIDLEELRRVFVSNVDVDEVLVDLIFRVVEGLSWKPDYLPYARRGLPTANIEPIRLLGHSFLFEIDQILKERTRENFTRWMDDITAGVDERRQGIELLSDVSDVLKSRGLALNLSKTQILSAEEAQFHFQIAENLAIDALERVKPGTARAATAIKSLWIAYRNHFKDQRARAWDKIAKRYITAFWKLDSDRLLPDIASKYVAYPGLRPNYLLYMTIRGHSQKAANQVIEILKKIDPFDDLSLFQLSQLVVQWQVPQHKRGKNFIKEFGDLLTLHAKKKKDPQSFFALLWFLTKYSDKSSLYRFLAQYQNIWQNNSFLRRQATSAMARFSANPNRFMTAMMNHQAMSGIPGTVSVANQIALFREALTVEPKLNFYLFPTTPPRIYPHGKFLVLCSVLGSTNIRSEAAVLDKISRYITDPWQRNILQVDFQIAF